MDKATLLGFIAGTLTTFSFLPQAVHTFKTRSAKDISLLTYSIFCIGIFLWLIYGLMIGSLPVTITNGITLVLALMILVMKIRFG
ncbi:MAG: SemiSWEET transporter [Candidatus Wallbacteria bacterium]|nr:SemiSWEET transporter [Candidatus Wallbacteria bacterium]